MKNRILVINLVWFTVFTSLLPAVSLSQQPPSYSAADILQQMKQLEVLGSVLYIAAHPDDENTRLLAYLANEKKYRTGYLSLTRGDGGQNLIGDEQGIELGLIRTQELLAARRIDGAEQFFTRAYDFGYSKSPGETLQLWEHEKILSDLVWVIRNFRPDIIISRFPTTGEGGHGHHTASAILAAEAFDAAADPLKFPGQLTNGITTWKATRLLWNTFNFGSNNTQREGQFKVDVGLFNPVLGKSYGEIAAESRSQHKSQGFGVPAQRGTSLEYFSTIKGTTPVNDLMDGVETNWKRVNQASIQQSIQRLLNNFKSSDPASSVKELVNLYKSVETTGDEYWKKQKLAALSRLIEASSGLFLDATTNTPYAVRGDSLKISVVINNRTGLPVTGVDIRLGDTYVVIPPPALNQSVIHPLAIFIPANEKLSQPYWLENEMEKGSYNVMDQALVGKAENEPAKIDVGFVIEGKRFVFSRPIRYKFTDPVKGELYQPVTVVPALTLNISPSLSMINTANGGNKTLSKNFRLFSEGDKLSKSVDYYAELSKLPKAGRYTATTAFDIGHTNGRQDYLDEIPLKDKAGIPYMDIREINYDHIPAIRYFKPAKQLLMVSNVKTAGKNVGYIPGAGDKVPQALEQLGYKVTILQERDIVPANLGQFDAIITGVRAYNTNDWLGNAYDVLMQYVKNGGVLLTQYNTNNLIGPVKAKMAPYPFTISRNRITDETAAVNFLLPDHPVLNYPNKITAKDFDGWIQERSIYNAENADSNYQRVLSMKDPGEKEQDGSLIIADYGKGRYIYTGLVFFRELPAGIPGAYRLFANLIASAQRPMSATGQKDKSK